MWRFIIISFCVWITVLLAIAGLATIFIPQRIGFLGLIPWANFDGVHYLWIAQRGYGFSQQAFFPLFPLLIHLLSFVFGGSYLLSSLFIVYLSLFVLLVLLWKLVEIDFNEKLARWTIIFLLAFPTSFFLASVYTESLFLMLVLASFYAARKKNWLLAGIFGFFATTTRFVGIFLLPALLWEWWEQRKLKIKTKDYLWLFLIPLGLASYMSYLKEIVDNPLAFINAQPAFGAGRSGGEIILLPQVIFRYIKIFLTVSWTNYSLWIAILEFSMFIFAVGILFAFWRRIKKSYFIFSILSIIGPTLTGTFSSMPRYIVVVFPFFIILALIENKTIAISLLVISTILLLIMVAFFTRGYFIA